MANMEVMREVCSIAEEFAHSSGLLKKSANGPVTLPVSLLPSPFPASMLHLAASLQQDINILYHRVSMDHQFLESTLKPTFALDEYIYQLWNIYARVKNEGVVQPIVLGLNRSDYMLHVSPEIKEDQLHRLESIKNAAKFEVCEDKAFWSGLWLRQVEVNMIATSFCGLSPRMISQHRQVLALMGFTPEQQKRVPECDSTNRFADAMARATDLYAEHVRDLLHQSTDLVPCILVIVSQRETNIYDQRALLGALLIRHPRIRILIRTFDDLVPNTKRMVINEQRRLFVDGQEISLIYYRHGYIPEHFPSDEIWEVKYQLERSRAIKCPCVQYLLANTKLIQAALSQPTQLARFIDPNCENFPLLLSTFARQYPLSDAFGLISAGDVDQLLEECRSNPGRFVLKPQREGGGNNYFGSEIVEQLEHVLKNGLGATYVLMERFYPYIVKNHVLGWENPDIERRVVLELGVFGTIIARADQIILNEEAGHLLRTKSADSNEGGIVAGFGCLDSPFAV
ncbi:Glutathione synthetase [Fasciola hepatica]|uniref:Glutathione synthetase n=1 Tax=Fasciola hepatica TaxID=6192 RepID=A0A4E0R753_FASHE|nr:Glutathione synthetase [Fasciola hepatica]